MHREQKQQQKRSRAEEQKFRKLQKAIASLPKPSFNNPSKAQPTKDVVVPSAVPSTLKSKTGFFADDLSLIHI